jgi:hypothetical protein
MSIKNAMLEAICNPRDVISQRGRHYVGREINKQSHSRLGMRKYNHRGIDIFSEEWDNLIILDSCRFDYFKTKKNEHQLPGKIESRISRGSQTPEWLWANFNNRELHDTVYITGNPMPYWLGVSNPENKSSRQQKYGFDLNVHELVNVWKGSSNELQCGNITTVPADVVAERAIEAAKDYPNKRLLIHILQPHTPYLGTPTGDEIHQISEHPWKEKIRQELDVSVEKLRRAYDENVDLAVRAAKQIINSDSIKGKTVVSADHGELLWEKSSPIPIIEVLHPNKTYIENLVKVPWLVIGGDRRKIISENKNNIEKTDQDSIATEQLEALGYK